MVSFLTYIEQKLGQFFGLTRKNQYLWSINSLCVLEDNKLQCGLQSGNKSNH
jgi:hypothetical protein